jgi:hypothetical protein
VFDQERFDELARGLATNRLSRAQVLKSFAAGLLLSFIGALSPRHTRVPAARPTRVPAERPPVPTWCKSVPNPAPPTPVKPTYIPPKKNGNVVKGDCKELRRRAKTGVKLPGRKDPLTNEVGHTDCTLTYKKLPIYETREFTKPGGSLVCLEITYVYPVTFTGRAKIYQLDWQPSSSACKDYESKIEKRIKDHEKVHANDCHAVANRASTVWNQQVKKSLVGFRACGVDPGGAEEAHNKIQEQITASLNGFLHTQIEPCAVDRGEKFDKAAGHLPICCEGPDGCGCPSGKECCKMASGTDTCVDLKTDPNNCGKCGKVCKAPNTSCEAGKCVCPPGRARSRASDTLCCPEGQEPCGGACVDSCVSPEVLDPDTCECGCPSGDPNCCPPGKTRCFGRYCIDLSTGIWNPESGYHDHCGACGVSCRRGSGAFCAQGKCQCGPGTPCSYEGCPPDKPNCHPNEKVYCCDPPGSGYPKVPTCCHSSQGIPYCCGSDATCGTSGRLGACVAL